MKHIINLFANKGGVGLTTTAALLALTYKEPTLLVTDDIDEFYDLAAVLGLAHPSVATEVRCTVTLTVALIQGDDYNECVLADRDEHIVMVSTESQRDRFDMTFRNLLVTRYCYLALRRTVAMCGPGDIDGIIAIVEPGRALNGRDAARAIGAPIVAELPYDPSIARAVDAGLLAARTPRSAAIPLALIHNATLSEAVV